MIQRIQFYDLILKKYNMEYFCPKFTQCLTENELIKLLPDYDGWIIGDDPVTEKVLKSGKKLKGCIRWGIGTDNVDFEACRKLNIPIVNTPNMFGEEVSDIAAGYLICLSRQIHLIHQKSIKKYLV